MDINTFMVTVFCLIDDWLQGQQIRRAGFAPTLHDSEVLTMEVVGEFLGYEADSQLWLYFRQHWSDWFPGLREVDRTTFVRQAANLWRVKEQLWQALLSQIAYDPYIRVIDSLPLAVCRFGRAYRCRRLREWSGWGYDDAAKHAFFGLRIHVVIAYPGVIVASALHPADVHDRWVAEDLLAGGQGYVMGDTNYWSPDLQARLERQGTYLITPRKTSVKRERHPWPRWLIHARRRIETVLSQLTERFHVKQVRAQDAWHLCSRWLRKVLSHTIGVFLAQQAELDSPLQLAELLSFS
jgi:hypothetical protein